MEMSDVWNTIYCKQELHNLINTIRCIYFRHDDTNQGTYNLVQSVKNFYAFYQKDEMYVEDYEKDFKSYYETSIVYGGRVPINEDNFKKYTKEIVANSAHPMHQSKGGDHQ